MYVCACVCVCVCRDPHLAPILVDTVEEKPSKRQVGYTHEKPVQCLKVPRKGGERRYDCVWDGMGSNFPSPH